MVRTNFIGLFTFRREEMDKKMSLFQYTFVNRFLVMFVCEIYGTGRCIQAHGLDLQIISVEIIEHMVKDD